MKQVGQNYRSGELTVLDVPQPACKPGGVLVRSLYSLISTGTEMMKVSEARLSLLGKARARPDQVRKVLDSMAQQGPVATYKKAMDKLDSYTPLGYSLCGVVVEVGAGAEEFAVGDVVAAAGNEFALHAEVNWVPVNLCVPVPEGVDPKHAAFATVGAIAMHGVRRGETQLGETACVIGLGLVGQLVVRLLVAAGVRVVGIDTVEERCRLAEAARSRELRLARRRGCRLHRAGHPHRHRRPGRRPRLPRCRWRHQRPRGARGAPRARPGTRRRHRQDPARPAVERVLREGARRPVLALLRPRPLRRPVRARRHRLPRRLRALDRAAQPRLLPRPPRRWDRRRQHAGVRHPPHRGCRGGVRGAGQRLPARGGLPLRVPERRCVAEGTDGKPAVASRAAPSRRPGADRAAPRHRPSGSASSAPAATRRRCCCRTSGSTRAPRSRGSRRRGRCRRSTPSASSASSR